MRPRLVQVQTDMQKTSPDLLNDIEEPFFREVQSRSHDKPVLVAFLRHFGCIFCREMVADISQQMPMLDAKGIEVAFVHVGSEADAKEFFTEFGMEDKLRFSDPESRYYTVFGVNQQSLLRMLSPETFKNGLRAINSGNRQGKVQGNPKAMPGLFLISKGVVVKKYIHRNPGDKPNLADFIGSEP